jgi:small subunit ribosomal protein S17
MAPEKVQRKVRKERIGEVISDRMAKTIVVRAVRQYPHPRFKKLVKAFKKYYVHDEKQEAKVGDKVLIVETRPLSKTKRWRLAKILQRQEVEVTDVG